MIDLQTNYLGLTLRNPLVAAASPLSEKVSNVQKMEEAGIAAVVCYSLFEEQIIRESLLLNHSLESGTYSMAEALTFFPDLGRYNIGPQAYVDHLCKLKESVSIPIIGSLNGVSSGGWIEYAQKIEQAGVDALELNLYYLPTNVDLTGSELEESYINLVADIHDRVRIPLAVKLSPFFTALPNLARRLVEAGASGLVLFNRFYQPDFDLDNLEVTPNLILSTSQELRLPLRWIALLYGRIQADFALTSGIHTSQDVLKAAMAGASISMLASELLSNGIERIAEILLELQTWMEAHEYISIRQMKGSMSQQAVAEPAAFERANYMKVLSSFSY